MDAAHLLGGAGQGRAGQEGVGGGEGRTVRREEVHGRRLDWKCLLRVDRPGGGGYGIIRDGESVPGEEAPTNHRKKEGKGSKAGESPRSHLPES